SNNCRRPPFRHARNYDPEMLFRPCHPRIVPLSIVKVKRSADKLEASCISGTVYNMDKSPEPGQTNLCRYYSTTQSVSNHPGRTCRANGSRRRTRSEK